jgi:hypothetical protein
MERFQTTYRGYQLTARELPGGGWQVDIVAMGGGKPAVTQRFAQPTDAFASARVIIDRGALEP